MTQLQEISTEYGIPIYHLGDTDIKESGLMVIQQHCVAILERTDRNEMIAEQL